MRTFAIYGATLAVVGVLGAGLGACSDGSGGLGGSGGSGDTGSSMAGTPPTNGGGTVIPTAGTGPDPGTAGTSPTTTGGTGSNPGTGGTTDPGTGGTPVVTGGTSAGGTGTGTAGTGTGTAGTGGGGSVVSGPFKVLIISTCLEFAHDSIPECQKMVADLGKADPNNQWTTKVEGDDLADFTEAGLKDYGMIFSCNPTGRVFSGGSTVKDKAGAMTAFQNFIEKDGKAFAGVHSASDFEKTNGFPWFTNTLMGAYFNTHDNDGTSGSVVSDSQNKDHSVLAGLAATYSTSDEWYKMNRDPGSQAGFKILQRLASDSRPLTWVKEVGTGRMFYTVRGHAKKVYSEEPFRTVVKNGILWATKRIN
jgi:type 1 glutamine amidotransferase